LRSYKKKLEIAELSKMLSINKIESDNRDKQFTDEGLKVVTLEEFRQFKKLDKYSDEEALEIINSIKELALITHKIMSHNEQS
jgi:flagellar hook-associated protein FlgK